MNKILPILILAATVAMPTWAQAPAGVTASVDGSSVRLAWGAAPSVLTVRTTDDMESLTPGDIGGIDVRRGENYAVDSVMVVTKDEGQIGPYHVIDNDHLAADYIAWAWGKGIPDLGQGQACQVLNTAVHDNSTSSIVGAHSGTGFLCFWSSNPRNDDYLILPVLSQTDRTIDFWAKSATNKYGLETYAIAYSTTGTDRADFQDFMQEANVMAGYLRDADAGYTHYTYELPEGAVYAAIHYNGPYCVALFVDDLSYATDHALLGYNVYRDGTKVNTQPVTTLEWTDTEVPAGAHVYTVRGAYADDQEGEASEEVNAQVTVATPPATAALEPWSHNAFGYYYLSGMVCYEPDDAGQATMVATDGTSVWVKSPISQLRTSTWLQGTMGDDGKVTFEFPQYVHTQDGIDFYAQRMVYKDNGTSKTYVVDTSKNTITMDVDATTGAWTLSNADKDVLMGLVREENRWTGYGDKDFSFSPVSVEPAAIPAAVAPQEWQLLYGDAGGRKVKVAFGDDGDVWISGVCPALPGAAIQGDLRGSVLTIPGGQYLGVDATAGYHQWLVTATVDKVWSTAQQAEIETPVVCEALTYDVDMAAQTITPTIDNSMWAINPVPDRITMRAETLRDVSLVVPGSENPAAAPRQPVVVEWVNDAAEYGFVSVRFKLPLLDTDGNSLDKSQMYFRFYLEGLPFTFDPAQYKYITEATELIPFGHNDNLDFWYYSGKQEHLVFLYMDQVVEIGVQSVRKDPDGNEYASAITPVTGEVGIDSPVVDTTVAHVEYYDMSGRRLNAAPANGLYIARMTMADGTVRAIKRAASH